MPPVRFLASTHYILLAILISLNSEIIDPYFYYMKKGLVYIAIAAPSSCQLFFYSEYTKVNTCFSYNMHLVSNNKYMFSIS